MAFEDIKLLKEGQEGFGVIVEWNTRKGCSGYISESIQKEEIVRGIIKEMEDRTGDGKKRPDSILMNCILQKCDTENRNGRFYPRYLLEREDKNYQTAIQDGNAGGEANHPDCYAADTELLTKNGWKYFSEVVEDEIVLTLNPETNKIEEHKINFLVDQEYDGDMIHFKGLNIDLVVTPNHRFLLEDRNGKRFFKTSEEIINSNSNKWKILKTGKWDFNDDENFIIKGINNPLYNINDKKEDLELNKKLFMAFMGIYLSEGHCRGIKSKKVIGNNNIRITQKKNENIILIEKLFQELFNNKISYSKYIRKNGTVDFSINDQRLFEYLYPLGCSSEKFIPIELKNSSSENLIELFNWFKLGDGRTIGKWNQSDVFSTSKKLINDLHEILIKCGTSGNIRIEERGVDKYMTEYVDVEVENEYGELELVKEKRIRLIKGINSKPMYFLNLSKTKNIWLDKRFLSIERVPSQSRIYCVNVINNNIYVRRNGKAMWCGNTSNLDVLNISHRVVKSWWEGNTLLGVLEIMTSRAFHETGAEYNTGDKIAGLLRRGYKLGISSRGVGSLKNVGGKNTVQDDFELICYDLVASPSTPGAYLYPDTEVKLNESVIEKKVENFSSSLISKLDDFLND